MLAHEIAHLVGINHISSKDSLMHPILQEKQIKNLFLTNDDISNFYEGF
ncbi:matrixin family metalloprotease [Poseidonibacter sp.]